MKPGYFKSNPLLGHSPSHLWVRWLHDHQPGKWYVCGLDAFTTSGFAVIDDFGNLVKVVHQ